MKAETHLEVYRPFEGRLRAHPWRFWPILSSSLRVTFKSRLALALLYLPPLIATVIFSFVVYARFAVEQALENADLGEDPGIKDMLARQAAMAIAQQQMQILEVKNQILEFHLHMALFGLLAVAWFGSGLFCDDKRAGAHQLYFARPLTRLDYFLGKFLCAAFFAALASFVPVLIICAIATFASPDWSFLKEEWELVFQAALYSAVWVTLVSSLTLAASSLATRKSFALVSVFGFLLILEALSGVLGRHQDSRFHALSPFQDMTAIAHQVMQKSESWTDVAPGTAWTIVLGVIVAAWLVIALRLRRLEVVA